MAMESNINNFEDQLIDMLRGERFNSEEPSEGHLERFLNKVGEDDCFAYARNDGAAVSNDNVSVIARERSDRGNRAGADASPSIQMTPRREIKFRRNTTTRRGFGFWKAICFPVAASIALVFIAGVLIKGLDNNKNFFAALDQNADSYAVYASYMQQVNKAYNYLSENTHIISEEHQDEFYSLLANITEETIPLHETLPIELSEEEKTAITKSYYTERLKAVESFEELLTQYINE